MSNEELVLEYQKGNRKALEELTEQNKGIIYKLANRYYTEKTSSIDVEDLIQEGYLGLISAAEKYNPDHEKKAQFVTYAIYSINAKIHRFIVTRNTNEETSLNIRIGEDEAVELVDTIACGEYIYDSIEEKIYYEQLHEEMDRAMCESMTLMEREVLQLNYGWNGGRALALNEVADLMDIPEDETKNIKNKSMRKLRNSNWCRLKRKEYFSERNLRSPYSRPAQDVAFHLLEQ